MARLDSVLDTVGGTPSIRLNRLAPEGVEIYVKAESFNPLGSVKDRLALGVIEDAERRGALKPGQTVVEATSGNTGIGLAMVCAAKGYPLVVTMAENFSVERRKLMRFLGAKVVLTPANLRGSGMLMKAVELAEEHGWFNTLQFENEANADYHSATTAVEILDDFGEDGLDYWVTGTGTGGTLKGVSRVLAERSPKTKVVVCEPDNAPMLGSGVPTPRDEHGAVSDSHPLFRPHVLQGWSPDFIPTLVSDSIEHRWVDRIVGVRGSDAMRTAEELARKEGILSGISGGGTLAVALELAQDVPPGTTILSMLADTGERYLSTPLFEDIPEEMTEEEIAISTSTPGYRFDVPMPTSDDEEEEWVPPPVTDKARSFVDEVVADRAEPVVMFSLEWCEFCWSARKMFKAYGIDYRSVDLDSVEYQEDDWGGDIRAALIERTDLRTIPQIFVGGEHVGGATEAFDAFDDGTLKRLLGDVGIELETEGEPSAYRFLPKWLQPR